MKRDNFDLSRLDIVLIKSAFRSSSTFIDDFDISCSRLYISNFKILFFIWYDWIVTLILSWDVREIEASAIKAIVNEFCSHFTDLPMHTERFASIENSFDCSKIESCKGILFSSNVINIFGMECFTSKE